MEPLRAGQRYRCTACANLTRFDITKTVRTKSFHHYTVGAELKGVEEEEVLTVNIEEVSCRWCGSGRAVEIESYSQAEVSEGPDTS